MREESDRHLKAQLADLMTKHYAQKQDLLIGDSLLKGIKQTKLIRTNVTSIPGAKIKDDASNLAQTENRYNRIVICAGTNNCKNDINIDETTEHLEHLLHVATERVGCGSNVCVSSIPPRTDDVIRQQRVGELNTIIQDVSAKVGLKFIANDKLFRLADGQPNDGYLCKDRLRLNYRGTSRLVDNLRLAKLPADTSKPAGNNGREMNSSKRKHAPVLSAQRQHDNDDNYWDNTTKTTINDDNDRDNTTNNTINDDNDRDNTTNNTINDDNDRDNTTNNTINNDNDRGNTTNNTINNDNDRDNTTINT